MGTLSHSGIAEMQTVAILLLLTPLIQGLNIDWKLGPKALDLCMEVGETAVFQWKGGHHNVVEVKGQNNFKNCKGFKESKGEKGPKKITKKKEGIYYFVCAVEGHCLGNQKPGSKSRNPAIKGNPVPGKEMGNSVLILNLTEFRAQSNF